MIVWAILWAGLVFLRQKWAKALVAALIVGYIILVCVGISEVPKFAQNKLIFAEIKNALMSLAAIAFVYFATKKHQSSHKQYKATTEIVPTPPPQEKRIIFDKTAKYGSFVGVFLVLNMIFFGLVGVVAFASCFADRSGEDIILAVGVCIACALMCYVMYGYVFRNKNYTIVLLIIYAFFTIVWILATFALPLFFMLVIPYGFTAWFLYNHLPNKRVET